MKALRELLGAIASHLWKAIADVIWPAHPARETDADGEPNS